LGKVRQKQQPANGDQPKATSSVPNSKERTRQRWLVGDTTNRKKKKVVTDMTKNGPATNWGNGGKLGNNQKRKTTKRGRRTATIKG